MNVVFRNQATCAAFQEHGCQAGPRSCGGGAAAAAACLALLARLLLPQPIPAPWPLAPRLSATPVRLRWRPAA